MRRRHGRHRRPCGNRSGRSCGAGNGPLGPFRQRSRFRPSARPHGHGGGASAFPGFVRHGGGSAAVRRVSSVAAIWAASVLRSVYPSGGRHASARAGTGGIGFVPGGIFVPEAIVVSHGVVPRFLIFAIAHGLSAPFVKTRRRVPAVPECAAPGPCNRDIR